MAEPVDSAAGEKQVILCGNCKAEVWWSFPRPEDKCPECGHEIRKVKIRG